MRDRRPRRRPLRALLVAVLALGALYLAAWPTPVDPESWSAPPPARFEGVFAPNGKLAAVEWLARGEGVGPEAIAIDASGDVYTGFLGGRIIRMDRTGGNVRTVATTGGRALGLAFGAHGALYVADGDRGLLRVDKGNVELLADGEGGRPFKFTDDLDVAVDGTVYFTDASWKFNFEAHELDILEHRPNGRLLSWSPVTKKVELLAGNRRFANGVALTADGTGVLFTETTEYRVMRYGLTGPKKGQLEVFAEGLPGFPDNITYSREKQRYWVALAAPRDAVVDGLSAWPHLRRAVARLPKALLPKPKRHAQIVALDLNGKVIAYLDHDAPTSFSPISSVREHDGWLYLGSFGRDAVGRIRAP